jgi:hypothetical protein
MLSVLLGVMAFTIDTGYLYSEKNRYQNAVEAAALAGASSLCEGNFYDIDAIVRSVAEANGLDLATGQVGVHLGFYDEKERYLDFPEYKDFAREEEMPYGEYVNAVLVAYRSTPTSLTGMGQDASLSSAAVAYLKRIDIASLDPQGAIHIGHLSSWENVIFFSNNNIMYPQAATVSGSSGTGTLNPPEFENCRLYAVGDVNSCPVEKETYFWGLYERISEILWSSGSPQSGSHIITEVDLITSIRPVDDEYLDEWYVRADIVYSPDDAGSDSVFYKRDGNQYYFDPAGENGVIFFDAGGSSSAKVFIGREYDHPPNGETIANLTFVANCPIKLINKLGTTWSMPDRTLYVGGEEEDQAVFISTGDIEVNATAGQRIKFEGTVFRTGGDFIQIDGSASFDQKIRIIADGSILGECNNTSSYAVGIDIGLYSIDNDSHFGPPCPPVLARLGRLEPAAP